MRNKVQRPSDLTNESKITDIHSNRHEIKRRTSADFIEFQRVAGGLYVIMRRGKTYRKYLVINEEIKSQNVPCLIRKIINTLGV